MPLTTYLIKEVLTSREQRIEGTLEFGTCTVSHADGTIAGLLGASPGASTAVAAMVDVLESCFPDRLDAWRCPATVYHGPADTEISPGRTRLPAGPW